VLQARWSAAGAVQLWGIVQTMLLLSSRFGGCCQAQNGAAHAAFLSKGSLLCGGVRMGAAVSCRSCMVLPGGVWRVLQNLELKMCFPKSHVVHSCKEREKKHVLIDCKFHINVPNVLHAKKGVFFSF